jgi:hypothetical protein
MGDPNKKVDEAQDADEEALADLDADDDAAEQVKGGLFKRGGDPCEGGELL